MNELPIEVKMPDIIGTQIKTLEDYKLLMNKPPKQTKKHPIIKIKTPEGTVVPYTYIPIESIHQMLDMMFMGLINYETRSVSNFLNAVQVIVRINYFHPVFKMWMYVDGVGAASLQVNASANPSDITQIKQDAVVMALPKAETEALKNAAKKLGKKFGRELNKQDTGEYAIPAQVKNMWGQEQRDNNMEKLRIIEHIEGSKSKEELMEVEGIYESYGLTNLYNAKMGTL